MFQTRNRLNFIAQFEYMKIAKKYELIGMLGKGKFGAVYQGQNVKTGEFVAVKLEKIDQSHVLKHETTILNYLYSKSCRNIPPVHMYGIVDSYAYLVMPFYTQSFDTFIHSKNPLDGLSIFMSSAIPILGNIHKYGVVHRDIKPENWMIREDELVLIDFGLATFYVDDRGQHIPFSQKTHIIGTPKYVSIRVHEGSEYSRRDDLISLAYLGASILLGQNVWNVPMGQLSLDILSPMNVCLREAKQFERLYPRIQHVSPELAKYMEYVYSLGFDEVPDYDKMKRLFLQKTI